MNPPLPQRAICRDCLRPQRSCICRWVIRTVNEVEVLILQHPLEQHHAKGSARLLHLSLAHSRLAYGESFDPQELQALLYQPLDPAHSGIPARQPVPVLLYPDTPALPDRKTPPAADETLLQDTQKLRLVVLDGTWRKSRKMLHLNPLLRQLPRLALQSMPASRYRIRKAHACDQLSTLEATCHALAQLEKNKEKYQPLLAAFDGFIAQQLDYLRPGIPNNTPDRSKGTSDSG